MLICELKVKPLLNHPYLKIVATIFSSKDDDIARLFAVLYTLESRKVKILSLDDDGGSHVY